jgi:hypothetical protein
MHSMPTPLIGQAINAFGPSGARLTGSMKMPAPMMPPTTTADVIQMPIFASVCSVNAALPPEMHATQPDDSFNSQKWKLLPAIGR